MNNISFRRIGSTVTGFLRGKMLHKDFDTVEKAKDLESLLRVYRKAVQENDENGDFVWEQIEAILYPWKRILKGDHLEVDGTGKVFAKGSKIPMPAELADFILELAEEGEEAMKAYLNFWKLCLLNPNTTARDSFFRYVRDHGVVITDNGYALLYKAVTHKEKQDASVDLAQFVAEKFVSVAMRGESPREVGVYESESRFYTHDPVDYYPENAVFVGHLSVLMDELRSRSGTFAKISETETIYTDKHTKSMDIQLGVQQVKDRDECDPDISRDCSYGLHVGSYNYVKSFGWNDDTIFLALVNPKDVVAVPNYDNSKIRVCAYLPIGIMEQDERGEWEAIEQSHFEMDYLDYEVDELESFLDELEDRLANDQVDSTFDLLNEQAQIVQQRIVELKEQKPETVEALERETAPHDSPSNEEIVAELSDYDGDFDPGDEWDDEEWDEDEDEGWDCW